MLIHAFDKGTFTFSGNFTSTAFDQHPFENKDKPWVQIKNKPNLVRKSHTHIVVERPGESIVLLLSLYSLKHQIKQ